MPESDVLVRCDSFAQEASHGFKHVLFGMFRGKTHSGMGIASFLIALLVGSLDVILAVVIATGIAHSSGRGSEELKADVVSGALVMVLFNCLSLPACIVGAGLAVIALLTQRDRNHLLTFIGLVANGLVIVTLGGLWLWGTLSR